MKLYKLKHIPTGLFFRPSRYPSKVNLSKNGKVYHRKPSLTYIAQINIPVNRPPNVHYSQLTNEQIQGYITMKTEPSDWEIIELKIESDT